MLFFGWSFFLLYSRHAVFVRYLACFMGMGCFCIRKVYTIYMVVWCLIVGNGDIDGGAIWKKKLHSMNGEERKTADRIG